jgi:Polyketide cyclase / dehydrase and lipid transport
MSTYHVEASLVIDALPEAIYHVLADYRVGHQAILPKPYFQELTIVQGGQGAGTELHVSLKAFGQTYHYHQMVSEPEPGRVLKETEVDTGQYTTFTLEPLTGGQPTRVTIASEFPAQPGLTGMLERLMQPPFVRRLYLQELRNLAAYLQRAT